MDKRKIKKPDTKIRDRLIPRILMSGYLVTHEAFASRTRCSVHSILFISSQTAHQPEWVGNNKIAEEPGEKQG